MLRGNKKQLSLNVCPARWHTAHNSLQGTEVKRSFGPVKRAMRWQFSNVSIYAVLNKPQMASRINLPPTGASCITDRFHQNQKGRKAAEKLGFVEWKLSYFCVNECYPWGNKFSLAWIYKSWQQRQEVTKTIVRSTVLWTCFQPGKAGIGQKEMLTQSDWWLVFSYQKYFPQNTTPVFCIIVFAKLILKGHDVSYGLEFDFITWVFIKLICTSKKKIKRRNYTIWMNFTSHVNVNDPTTLMLR